MGPCLVAYSGGVDSTFLLRVAKETLGNQILAVTADSFTYPDEELKFSRKMCRCLGVRQKIIKTSEFKNPRFIANPLNRCYFCKKELFAKLKELAKKEKLNFVIDASNFSDKKDFRPGEKATKELGIRSPLRESGLTKEEIRRLSKQLGLPTWDKPSLACLASRIPYGNKISKGVLQRINSGESFIRKFGIKQVRMRDYQSFCRIEVPKPDILKLVKNHKQIIDRLKKLGYNYITIDLEGYRTGSLNETYIS